MNSNHQRKFSTLNLVKLLHTVTVGLSLITVILAVTTLAGCGPTKQELAVQDMAECRSYGFKPGTDGFANCRISMEQERSREDYRRQMAASAAVANFNLSQIAVRRP